MLLALGGLQGLVGWWMVKSGLEGRVSVAPERLATHLGLALILFAALIWTALEAWSGRSAAPARPAARRLAVGSRRCSSAGVFVQCLLGALVAGNQAGLIDNDWPLMGGRLVPPDYWQGGALGDAGAQPGRGAVQPPPGRLSRADRRGRDRRRWPRLAACLMARRAAALGAGGGRRRGAAGAAGGRDADDRACRCRWPWRTRPAPRSCSAVATALAWRVRRRVSGIMIPYSQSR